jgi:hypothetical protein
VTIERKNPYGRLDPAALAAFEQSLRPLRLPDEFRAFLVEFNGAHFPESAGFDDVGGTELGDLFGLHAGPEYLRLDHAWADFRDFVPPPFLVFASDPYGNYFAMSLDGRDRGAIYFVDHEVPVQVDELPKVANTFTDFLQRAGANVAPPRKYADIGLAIRAGDHEAVRDLLAHGASAIGYVHAAVAHGDLALLETILDAGGDPDERGGIGDSETPLFAAARHGRADLAGALIDRGANVNLRCSAGGTALEMAEPYPKVVAVLARAGAEPTNSRLSEMVRRFRSAQ